MQINLKEMTSTNFEFTRYLAMKGDTGSCSARDFERPKARKLPSIPVVRLRSQRKDTGAFDRVATDNA